MRRRGRRGDEEEEGRQNRGRERIRGSAWKKGGY